MKADIEYLLNVFRNLIEDIRCEPLLPNFYQQEDLGTSNHGVQLLGCNCANNSFPVPEYFTIPKTSSVKEVILLTEL